MRCCSVLSSLALTFGIVAPVAVTAQGGSVAGTVVNRATGAPVAAAQVTVAGTALRAFTDASGRFTLNDVLGTTAVLQIRMIGFRARTDTVNVGDTNVRIALDQKALELEQVVVTGTAAATAQRELGHTVSRINAAEVTQQGAINSVQDLLNGRAAGVLIQPATGAVGSGSRIRIRGASSLSLTNQPLVYVDGVRVDADFATGPQNQSFGSSSISRFNDFNPDDIENVEIVKGPAATTLYGTEASNGVIQIITKRGTQGAPRWNFTLRQGANLTVTPSEQVTLSANLGYVTGPTHLSAEAGFGGRVWTTVLATPTNLGTFRDGFWSGLPAEYDQVYHFTQGLDRFTGSIQLQHHPVKWFSHRLTFGVDRTREENSELYARVDSLVDNPTFGSDALGYIAITNRAIDNTTVDYAATASFDLSPTIRSSTSGGLQFYHTLTDTTFADGQFFAAAGLTSIDATTGPRSNAGGLEETKSIGAYGQEQIAWRDRVFLTGGLRADQHSTFSANFKRVWYPKASASWVISDEPFWKYPFVNQLRLRAAYGESGRAPPYNAAVRVYRPVTGPGDVSAVTPQNIGNPNLEPERGKELELGFDAGFWNDRLGLEFTYYRKRTTNEILQREIAPSIGFPPVFPGAQYFNAGAVLNQGIELLARGHPYDRGAVSVDMTLNLATNSNEIQELLPGVTSVSAGTFLQHRVGYAVGSWFGRKVVSAQLDGAGHAINVLCDDGNGGTVACGGAPNVFLGRTIPNFEGAFNTTLTLWKRLRVSGLLDFKTGYRKMDGNTRVRCTVVGEFCRENFFPQEFDPKRIAGIQSGGSIVDYLIDDASFMKLREVSANYALPERWASAIGANRASVTLAGRNLHTWTRYGGLEPEAMFLGGTRGGNFSAWEQTDLPQLTQWVVTVSVDY